MKVKSTSLNVMVHGRNLMILIYWISAKHAWIGLQRTETWFAKKSTWDATVRGDYYMLTELKLQLFNALLIYLAFSMKFYCLCCQSWEALWWWTRMSLQHWLVVCYLKPICWWLKLNWFFQGWLFLLGLSKSIHG